MWQKKRHLLKEASDIIRLLSCCICARLKPLRETVPKHHDVAEAVVAFNRHGHGLYPSHMDRMDAFATTCGSVGSYTPA